MSLADQMRTLSKENPYKKEAFECAKQYTKRLIESYAKNGKRSCPITFECVPGNKGIFLEKYGEQNEREWRRYDIEQEMREYFENEGFTFKYITNAINGGVRQDPYWTICW